MLHSTVLVERFPRRESRGRAALSCHYLPNRRTLLLPMVIASGGKQTTGCEGWSFGFKPASLMGRRGDESKLQQPSELELQDMRSCLKSTQH